MRMWFVSVALSVLVLFAAGWGCGSRGAGSTAGTPVFWGIAYGPFRANQTPNGGPQPTVDQMRADMPRLAALGGRVRTYTVAGDQAQVPMLANTYGLRAWVGGWIGRDSAQNDAEMQRLISVSSQPGVEAVIVGNEVLTRADVTTAQLVAYIRQVKSKVQTPVAYADTWYMLEQHPEVVKEVDIALANVHPYWDSVPAAQGATYVLARFNELRARYPSTQFVIGETGWPSAGSVRGHAVAGGQQQRDFLGALRDQFQQHPEMRLFAFEAFDESFKQEENVGTHWGLYNLDGSTKGPLASVIPTQPPDAARLAAAGEILSDGRLRPGLNLEVSASSGLTNWVTLRNGDIEMDYPSGQQWGAIVFTTGMPAPDVSQRSTRDFSAFTGVDVDLRGAQGGERVSIGVKTDTDPDDGREPTYGVNVLKTDWQTIHVPVAFLARNPFYPQSRFSRLYVVCEIVFDPGIPAETVFVRNIRFTSGG